MLQGPDDRPKKRGKRNGAPKIERTANLRVPDKEMHIMRPDEGPPEGGGTCACHSVCTCVPVTSCPCDVVCACDTVCATNTCACDAFHNPLCACDPQCTCEGVCSGHSICTCVPVTYSFPT